jgi:hypothetical protein
MASPQMELAEDGDLHARLKKQRGRPLKEEVILNCERRCQQPLLPPPTAITMRLPPSLSPALSCD